MCGFLRSKQSYMETQSNNSKTSPVVGALCMGITFVLVALLLGDTANTPQLSGNSQVANVIVIKTQSLEGWRERGALTAKAGTREYNTPIMAVHVPAPQLSAKAFIAVSVPKTGSEQVLASSGEHTQFLIASVTKLMTALVAREKYKGYDEITVSTEALSDSWVSGAYTAGTKLFFKDALYSLLIPSHNEIANAIAEREGKEVFVQAMNDKASELGLSNTHFINPNGLDEEGGVGNYSTAFDIYTLARHIYEHFPDILSVTAHTEFQIFNTEGGFITTVRSTNNLLSDIDPIFSIVGGKTGSTPQAKQNLVIVSDAPCAGTIVSVVLGSDNSFADMRTLLAYARDGWVWVCGE